MSFSRVRFLHALFTKTTNKINSHYSPLQSRKYSVLGAHRQLFIQSSFLKIKMSSVATFDEVKAVKDKPSVLLVDVREPSELQETGTIPGSINIPLGEFESALKDMPGEEFKQRYGCEKPASDVEIITSCRLGGRAAKAQEMALKLGYTNVKCYAGSWEDWVKKNK